MKISRISRTASSSAASEYPRICGARASASLACRISARRGVLAPEAFVPASPTQRSSPSSAGAFRRLLRRLSNSVSYLVRAWVMVQKSEVRGQKSEVRGQRSEVREVRGQKSGVRSQGSESGVAALVLEEGGWISDHGAEHAADLVALADEYLVLMRLEIAAVECEVE